MRICGRHFSQADLDWIRSQIDSNPGLNRAQLSRSFCRYANWLKPDGELKQMSCRVAMLQMDRAGLIRLPAAKNGNGPMRSIAHTAQTAPQDELALDVRSARLSMRTVERNTSSLWNEFVDRYHYLGCRRTGGAQMRFFIHAHGQPVALLGFSAAAWKVASRDTFIGWTIDQRRKHLHCVVDNNRFLILPWVRGKNLASRILGLMARTLPELWHRRYGYRPVLLETFVETPRFAGTCYKAANWICVGRTKGRGKYDRQKAYDKPVKTVWLYPLDRRFKKRLCQ